MSDSTIVAAAGAYVFGAMVFGGYAHEDTRGDRQVTACVAFFWPVVMLILLLAIPFEVGAAFARRGWRK